MNLSASYSQGPRAATSPNVQEWKARRGQAEAALAAVGATAAELDAQLEQQEASLRSLISSRDSYYTRSRRVSDSSIKVGIGLMLAGVVAEKAAFGTTVTWGLVGGGLALAISSMPVNMALSVVLARKGRQLEEVANERLATAGRRRQLASAEEELKQYDRVVGETERLMQALHAPGGSVRQLGDVVFINGVKLPRRR